MKRKQFIQNIALVGVGLGLAPIKLFAANASVRTFALPKAAVHIPHGNFAAANLKKLIIPEFGLECSVQHFMRNGISLCDDDLTVCSFQRGVEMVTICFTVNGKPSAEGSINGLEVSIHSSDRDSFTIREIST